MKVNVFLSCMLLSVLCSCGPSKEVIKLKIRDSHSNENFRVVSKHTPFKAVVTVNSNVENGVFGIGLSNSNYFNETYSDLGKGNSQELFSGDWYNDPMEISYLGSPTLSGEIEIVVTFFY